MSDSLVSLFQLLQQETKTVQIQKLAETSRIDDCGPQLWKAVGMEDRRDRCPVDAPYPLIGDLPHAVWRCKIGYRHRWYYGNTVVDAISAALEKMTP